jgi:hypothetical protein
MYQESNALRKTLLKTIVQLIDISQGRLPDKPSPTEFERYFDENQPQLNPHFTHL